MSSVVAIDLGSSCHRVVVSEKNALGNAEYSPTTLFTDTGSRSFRYSDCTAFTVDVYFHIGMTIATFVIIVLRMSESVYNLIRRILCFIAM